VVWVPAKTLYRGKHSLMRKPIKKLGTSRHLTTMPFFFASKWQDSPQGALPLNHWFKWKYLRRAHCKISLRNSPMITVYDCPRAVRDLSINRFFEKHSHHLLGFPSGVLNTRSHTRSPVSWRTWKQKYISGLWKQVWTSKAESLWLNLLCLFPCSDGVSVCHWPLNQL
jgi:hypothetical protein